MPEFFDRCYLPGWEGVVRNWRRHIMPVLQDFIVTTEPGRCCVCQQETYWADLNFIGHLHPGRCSNQMWADYRAAMRC